MVREQEQPDGHFPTCPYPNPEIREAMALGMADVIQSTAGYVQIDAMFIDEGFGSLDEESRMRAIRILQDLAGGKRLIGIISHVQELKDQIDRKLIVKKDEKGSHVYWQE